MKKRPLHIAIIADALDYQYAGIYYYTKEILHAIAKIDSYNQYLFVRSLSEGDISTNVKELVIPTGKFPGAGAYRLFVTIPKILESKNIDIVVEPRHFGPFNLSNSIKRVTFIHDLSPLHHPEWHQFISRTLQKIFLPSILKKADHILTNSTYTKQDIINHFPYTTNKITTTLLGKEEFFSPQSNLSLLNSLGINTPYLLHVGTIEPRKNLSNLLQAFENYKKNSVDNLKLILIGKKGWKSTDFFEHLEVSPYKKDIQVVGYVKRNELVALYSSATAFIFPSLFEGFGLPVLEAMSCGCPVICSNAASLSEIGGDACLYFSPNDVNEITQSIKTVVRDKDLQERMSKASLQQASKFSWIKTASTTLAVFQNLVN